jgi:tellurite resistance protein TerC
VKHPILFPLTDYWWVYLGFVLFILGMLALDLGVLHRQAHTVTFREAGLWVAGCIALALLFNAALYVYCLWVFPEHPALTGYTLEQRQDLAGHISLEFLTGYVVEKSLAVDNIFVFVVVFSFFGIPGHFQHRVLHLGIIGALLFRAIFIGLGTLLLQYKFVVWIFGGFLVFTGIKMIFTDNEKIDPSKNIVLRLLRRFVPVTAEIHGSHFFIRQAGRWVATPLFVALVFLEFTDIIFAIDSVPAIFAITNEPLIVFTSNIFAILGLRSMYFLLSGSVDKFHLLKFGLAAVLVFVGVKMVWLNELYHGEFPISYSLMIIAGCIGGSIVGSLVFPVRVHEEVASAAVDNET